MSSGAQFILPLLVILSVSIFISSLFQNKQGSLYNVYTIIISRNYKRYKSEPM